VILGALSDERTGLSFTIAAGPRSAVILGSESRGTHDHILLSRIRDFLFVASYDSQSYGGGI
jgi:spore germination protein YaaH